jgi:type IV pilus assembly protein PilY1
MNCRFFAKTAFITGSLVFAMAQSGEAPAAMLNLSTTPLFLTESVPPLTLLVMGRDHKLYYEAYNDASDLNGDGQLDVGYKPTSVDYFGYFDSHKCYTYDTTNRLFAPNTTTINKRCSGASEWSGDFLNYLTTSRIDALRKVLYGGYRSTDSATQTVLQRAYIPQDAHSWGKEYESIARDGYDITEYTPLDLPDGGTRHLFANTTLSDNGAPLLRVLTNSSYRIWEWVSIERPVAGNECATSGNARANCATPSGNYEGHPADHNAFDALVAAFANSDHLQGSGTPANGRIDGSGNPFGNGDYYLTLFRGTLNIVTSGTYEFAVDGDDAVELMIDGAVISGWYGGHCDCVCDQAANASSASCTTAATYKGLVSLTAGAHSITFRHQERQGGDNYWLYWRGPDSSNAWQIVPTSAYSNLIQYVYDVNRPESAMTDYEVRVDVCRDGMLESNCRQYGTGDSTVHKPTGLLHDYGENDRMLFGLLTGSYHHNLQGGVLRKNIGSLTDEISSATGQWTSTVGIIKTIDQLRTAGFNYSCPYCYTTPPGVVTRAVTEADGQGYQMWDNPVAEMMYEGLRYFAGKTGPTSDFSNGVSGSSTHDSVLGLPLSSWTDPYSTPRPWCAKPFMLVMSDINPSYDTDRLPGSFFDSGFVGDLSGLDVQDIADTIWGNEMGQGASALHFIGQSDNTYDGAPTAKSVNSFGNIRGLSPEEPTKQGGYYSASIAYFGRSHDINAVNGGSNDEGQKVDTFVVALASPLPRIEIPAGDHRVTMVPFAKSVGGCGITNPDFQPTNQIVDFYVETIKNTHSGNTDAAVNGGRPYYRFRINFEDTEQGSDHDMDAIVAYEMSLNADHTLTVGLNSTYAAGCVAQHMGYVISGTTADGTYLEVRDCDTAGGHCGNNPGTDPDYFLDTPAGQGPGGNWQDGQPLPLTATRTFTPGSSTSASLLKDPLWYAAKWGGFQEQYAQTNDPRINDKPDELQEWDADHDGTPDNYFLVTNALNLGQQLSNAFEEIIERTSSAASVATNSGALQTNSRLYQARFNSKEWSGQLLSFPISNGQGPSTDPCNSQPAGSLCSVEWDAGAGLDSQDWNTEREMITYNPSTNGGVAFRWANLDTSQQATLDTHPDTLADDDQGQARLEYLRGNRINEGQGNNYRVRARKLGDLIQSDPFFVGTPGFSYPDNLESSAYSSFRATSANRTPVVYIGGNDGMLHGFDASVNPSTNGPTATSGEELIAYVPSEVYRNLSRLTSPNYSHRYYVDGSPTVGDAFIGSWKTVLVGGLRAGGQGYFALDVTNPGNFSEAHAASLVLWEFSDEDDPDLGYSFSQPAIVKMQNGKWAAVFGNGYNNTEDDDNGACDDHNNATPCTVSSTGHAVLYIVFIEDGIDGTWDSGDFIKIDTEVGTTATPNGLASPTVVDINGDHKADYIYAGDLQGNLWKFDVDASNSNSWDVAFSDHGDPAPLFVAKDATGNSQPITSALEVGLHPAGLEGLMVYFGTGKYIEVGDNNVSGAQTQTFYGIWDKDDETQGFNRTDDLLQQTVEEQVTAFGFELRVVSDNPINWRTDDHDDDEGHLGWYLDLPTTGEKQVSESILRDQRIIFTTLIPSGNVCEYGGTGWLIELDPANGGRLTESVFDLNNDGTFSQGDFVEVNFDVNDDEEVNSNDKLPASGKMSEIGIIPKPTIISGQGVDFKYTSGSKEGKIEMTKNNPGPYAPGRKSWRQLQ